MMLSLLNFKFAWSLVGQMKYSPPRALRLIADAAERESGRDSAEAAGVTEMRITKERRLVSVPIAVPANREALCYWLRR